jgi:hypothetical protein
LGIDSLISNAKNVFGRNWDEKMSFGIYVFYFWVQIFYMKKEYENCPLKRIFETVANV